MVSVAEIEKLASALPVTDRAMLASHLLQTLPPVLDDDDEGVAEALVRDAEMDASDDVGISLDQLDQQISARRR